ncbi:MAG: hypothetical protein ABWZ26_01245 [Candidatus Nanopelagicales bacterium]
MHDDPVPTQIIPRPAGPCTESAHQDPVPFGQHVELGLVPARSATVIGAVILALVVAAVAVWAPSSWLVGLLVLLVGGVVGCLVVQLALGHRGWCLIRRTVRWSIGSVGALLDPFDAD